jgi:hypothetical protein
MKPVKVKQHRRVKKGATVKAHTRKLKTTADKPGAGKQIKVKAPAAAKPAFVRHKKGSPEASAHMAKLRAMRKPK